MKYKILKTSLIIIAALNQAHSNENYKTKQKQNDSFDYYKQPATAQNGSFYGEINKNNKYKNEYVNSYKHKDGRRVKSYYRNRKSK